MTHHFDHGDHHHSGHSHQSHHHQAGWHHLWHSPEHGHHSHHPRPGWHHLWHHLAGHGGRGHDGRGRDGGPFGGGFGPFDPGGFGWRPFRRAPRARRGDVRAAILVLLQEEPRNGYQIMQELKLRSQGLWNPSPGSVYPALQQLEDERLIATQEGPGGRVFALTSLGQAYVAEHAAEIAAPWEALSEGEGGLLELMGLFRQLGAAAMQVAQAGDAAQIAKAKKILVTARRSLYELLAAEPSEDV